MDDIEEAVILALGEGPKTVWWLAEQLAVPENWIEHRLGMARRDGFVEERGEEFLYPQTDRRDGVRRKRGRDKRLKTWTATRKYYALTVEGRVLLPLNQIIPGVVEG